MSVLPADLPHETLHVVKGRRSGLTISIAVHSTVLGPALGGCRVWTYDSWQEAVADSLRLAEGMTYKNAAAGLNRGGGRSPVFTAPFGTLDAHVSYDITDNISVSLEAINILSEPIRTYGRDVNQLWFAQELHPQVFAGARFKF